VLAFLLVYLACQLVALVVAFLLWYLSGFGWQLRSPTYQAIHYGVLRRMLWLVLRAARWLFRLDIRTDGLGWSPLDDGVPGSENAMIVLSRHAGPGDSFLLVETLMNRDHRRRPRIVLKDTLQLDPVVDVYLNRLPSGFLTAGRAGLTDVIAHCASGLGDEDALLIFPEGGNFTAGRRRKAIESLRGKGFHDQAGRAERCSTSCRRDRAACSRRSTRRRTPTSSSSRTPAWSTCRPRATCGPACRWTARC
jgi:1-acyl-sn-glycerol-3-phosphate acyltransferase